ncbi:MAG: PAS domain-containing protein [Caulobacteraceae bacterium]
MRPQIEMLVVTAERELALFEAHENGAHKPWREGDPAIEAARGQALDWFQGAYGGSSTLASLIDPRPGLMIVDVNPIYAAATGVTPADIAGRPLFVAFPDSPDDRQADGVANLYASLRRVAETGVSETMPVQRYDTRDPVDGAWCERYWRIENSAVTDDSGRLLYLLHLVAEVDRPA